MTVNVLLPCFNDAATAIELIHEIRSELGRAGHAVRFTVVDDGSHPPLAGDPGLADPAIRVVSLRRNLGHQRAIACGLCVIHTSEVRPDAIVVMDSDGEDKPSDIPHLLARITPSAGPRVVFAERAKRSEALRFRIFYQLYLGMHFLLVGHAPRVGNFSALDARLLGGLVTDADLWSHYAATLWKSNWTKDYVPLERGHRRRGTSRLNFYGLVLHGLSAISCYWEIISVRMLFLNGLLLLLTLPVIPLAKWAGFPAAATVAAALSPAFFILTVMGIGECLRALNRRNQMAALPIRDFHHFIAD